MKCHENKNYQAAPNLWRFAALMEACESAIGSHFDTQSTEDEIYLSPSQTTVSKPTLCPSFASKARQTGNGIIIKPEFGACELCPFRGYCPYEMEGQTSYEIEEMYGMDIKHPPPELPEVSGTKKRRTGPDSFVVV